MRNFFKLVGYTVAVFAILVAIFWGFETLQGHDITITLSRDIIYVFIGFLILCVLAFIASLF